jgi:hypothetical protein
MWPTRPWPAFAAGEPGAPGASTLAASITLIKRARTPGRRTLFFFLSLFFLLFLYLFLLNKYQLNTA